MVTKRGMGQLQRYVGNRAMRDALRSPMLFQAVRALETRPGVEARSAASGRVEAATRER